MADTPATPTKKRPAVTLEDLVQLEKTAKAARHQYELLSKAGAGGTFEVLPKGPFGLDAAVVVEVKPRSLYQRFYHQVTSKTSIQWLAAAYGGERLRAMLAVARAEPGRCKLGGGRRGRGRAPTIPDAEKPLRVALAFAPCLALIAGDGATDDAALEALLAFDILGIPANMLKIQAICAALKRWDANGDGLPATVVAAPPVSDTSDESSDDAKSGSVGDGAE
jgi:hypothetical protein